MTRSAVEARRGGVALVAGVIGLLAGSAIALAVGTSHSSILSSRRRRVVDEGEDDEGRRRRGENVVVDRGLPSTSPSSPPPQTLPVKIRTEQLSRNALYFGQSGMSSLSSSSVCVVGLGGVGSHCANMLARSGVGYLRLIDFDQVTLSSLNRHACATLEDVGTPKATCLAKFLRRVCPDETHLRIDDRVQMYTGRAEEDGDLLDGRTWNVLIDAIDDVPTKAALLAECVSRNVRVVSCMGAGGKADVTRLHVSDLRSASRDPLASKLRQSLRRLMKQRYPDRKDESYMDDIDKIAVLYSSEPTVMKLAEFTEEQKEEGVTNYGAVDGMRIRVLPVLGTTPAIMGQGLAAYAICELGGKPFSPVAGERVGRNVRHKLLQHLKRREKKIRDDLESKESTASTSENGTDKNASAAANAVVDVKKMNPNEDKRTPRILSDGDNNDVWVGPVQIDSDDVEYLLSEVWRNRCALTGQRLGVVLELARWDTSKPSTCDNLVLMTAKAMEDFDTNGGREGVEEETRGRIERRLAGCRIDARA